MRDCTQVKFNRNHQPPTKVSGNETQEKNHHSQVPDARQIRDGFVRAPNHFQRGSLLEACDLQTLPEKETMKELDEEVLREIVKCERCGKTNLEADIRKSLPGWVAQGHPLYMCSECFLKFWRYD